MRPDPEDNDPLFDEFTPTPTRKWVEKIKKDLGGDNYRKKLRWDTGEGVAPLPFYRREDLEEIDHPTSQPDGVHRPWQIRSAISASTIRKANRSALKALRGGSDALHIIMKLRPVPAGGPYHVSGVPLYSQSDFVRLFENIPLEETPIHFDAGALSPALLAMFWQETISSRLSGDNLKASFSYDPFASSLYHGSLYSKPEISKRLHETASFCLRELPRVRPLAIDARLYHNSGGTIIQELGFALSAASEYLAILTQKGHSADEIANMLHFNLATGSSYFLEIAKFRALRLLWSNLLEAYKGNPKQCPAYIHAESSKWNKTGYDPYTNMLRTTTEGMSAALAGCDAITVSPFDETFRETDDFSQRIARNSQVLMREEAHLDKVEDPAAGSYYIEILTDDIARKAWQLFQKVEQRGGMAKAIEEGFIQSSISTARQERNRSVAHREHIFVGTSHYPSPGEERASELNQPVQTVNLETSNLDWEEDEIFSVKKLADLFGRGATTGDAASLLLHAPPGKTEPLHPYRGARAFEELRAATENHPTTPKVLNLPIGDPKIRKRRSAFSNNFFGCVGYHFVDLETAGFENISEAVKAIDRHHPDIAVLCSTDKAYKKLVPAYFEQIGDAANPPLLILAGYPEEDVEFYRDAGLEFFIYPGCNVLQSLKEIQQKLGIVNSG